MKPVAIDPQISPAPMRRSGVFSNRWWRDVLAVVVPFLAFTYVTSFAYYYHDLHLLPVRPFVIQGFLSILALVIFAGGRLSLSWLQWRLAFWIALYIAVTFVWLILFPRNSGTLRELEIRIIYSAFAFLAMFAVGDERSFRKGRQAILVAIILGSVINLYEIFDPNRFSESLGRSAGLFLNPNISAAALLCGCLLCMGMLDKTRRTLLFILVCAAVFATLSRAMLLILPFVCLWLLATHYLSGRIFLLCCLCGAICGIVAFGIAGQLPSKPKVGPIQEALVSRLQVFASSYQQEDFSTRERKLLIANAVSAINDAPIFGKGVGANNAGNVLPSHDIYLDLAVQHGILGFLLYPLLLILIGYGAARNPDGPAIIALLLFFAWWGLFSHNSLDQRDQLLAYVMTPLLSRWRPIGS